MNWSKSAILGLCAGAAFGLAPLSQSQAQSTVQAYTTTNLNQRAGPGTRFPVVIVVPARAPVAVYGCLRDFSWCDGSYQGQRGWLSARYLQLWYQGAYLSAADYARYTHLPIVAFNINTYWPRYYANAPFYAELTAYASGGSVQVNIGSFYRPLAPHGRWVEVRGRYVWVPRVAPNWRPYSNGRWVFTERYGWTWVSNEPFGWATYHYGRWAYSPTLGWFWVPGTRWAPAWVAWRGSNDHLAWAPLPPDPQDSFGIGLNISIGNIPNYYWQAVPSQNFLDTNLANVIIGDNNQVTNIVNQTQVIGSVNIVNNVVVNNVINIEYVEEKTQEDVVARQVALDPAAPEGGTVEGNVVAIYQPPAAELVPEAAPPEVTPLEQAAQESTTAGQVTDQPSTEELVPPPPPADEPPPPNDTPPVVGDSGEPATIAEDPAEAAPPAPPAGPLPANLPEPCPDGTIRLNDGSCAPPPEAPPPAEEVTPETSAAPTEAPPPPPPDQQPPAEQAPPAAEQMPGEAAPTATEAAPPPAEAAPPPAEQPPPAEAAPPAAEQAPPPACPEGTVMQADGTCAPPAAPPAETTSPQEPPAPPAEQPAPPPAEPSGEAPPPPPPAEEPPPPAEEAAPPPAEQAPPPAEQAPPPEQAAPPAGEPQGGQLLPPCPEGYVVSEQGVCVLPPPQ